MKLERKEEKEMQLKREERKEMKLKEETRGGNETGKKRRK